MKKKISNGYSACTVRVGEKCQIVIPKEMREMFGIEPGDTLMLLADIRRGIAIPPKTEIEKVTRTILAASFAETEEERDNA